MRRVPTALLLGALAAPGAFAQAELEPEVLDAAPADPGAAEISFDPTPPRVIASAEGFAGHAFRADLDGLDGDVSVWRYGGGVSLTVLPDSRWRISVGITYDHTNYSFNNAEGLISGSIDDKPFEDLHHLSIGGNVSYALDQTWAIVVAGFVTAGWEPGADFGDALTGGIALGASYRMNDEFRIGFGLGVASELEDDPQIFPLVILEWKFAERWTLETEALGPFQNQGGSLSITYAVCDELDLFFQGGFERRRYRLSDDRQDVPGGVVRDSRVPIGVGAVWKPVRGLEVSIGGGVFAFQEFEFFDRDSDDRGDRNTDITPYLGFQIEYTF